MGFRALGVQGFRVLGFKSLRSRGFGGLGFRGLGFRAHGPGTLIPSDPWEHPRRRSLKGGSSKVAVGTADDINPALPTMRNIPSFP